MHQLGGGLPGGSGDVRGDDIGGMAVQRGAGPVIAHGGARISVGSRFLDIPQRDPSIQTGSERFTNRVEYLKSRSGEMGSLVLVGASLPLPPMHQRVMWPYRS